MNLVTIYNWEMNLVITGQDMQLHVFFVCFHLGIDKEEGA
jgi:hypothetical protein